MLLVSRSCKPIEDVKHLVVELQEAVNPDLPFTADDEPRASTIMQVGHPLHRRGQRISFEEADGGLGHLSFVVLMRIGELQLIALATV